MTIPKHDDIRTPALALLLELGQLRLAEFEAPLAADAYIKRRYK